MNMATESIMVGLVGLAITLAYFSRNTEQDYLRGLFGTLSIYVLIAIAHVSRIVADEIVNNSNMADFLGTVYIITLLLGLFITVFNFYTYFRMLILHLKNKGKGVFNINDNEEKKHTN